MSRSSTNIISKPEAVIAGNSLSASLKVFSELTKFRITVLVSFTTGLGYILAAEHISFGLFCPILGIFLLACASSCLNHYQERDTDALMDRTKLRPIPSGRVEPLNVLFLALFLLIAGSVVLLTTTNFLTFLIGIFTFVWYNGIYTPLKKLSAFAIIPGSLVGALPPVAGWVAAGGYLFDSRILIIAVYFFIWQIPHFWLLLMLYGSDYEKGGFPVLTKIFSHQQLKRITFMWLITNVLTAMLIPIFGIVNFSFTNILLLGISAWMIYLSVRFFRSQAERKDIRNTFIGINFYTLMLITILCVDKIVRVF